MGMISIQTLHKVVLKILSLILNPLKYIYTLNSFSWLFCSSCVKYGQRIDITCYIGRVYQIGACRDLVLLGIFINDFGIENMILKVADVTKLEEITCILQDRIIIKIILTNCASSLKYRMKFNVDMQKALQLNRNKPSKCMKF